MAEMTDFLEANLIQHTLTAVPYAPTPPFAIRLYTTLCSESLSGAETSFTGYAPQPVAFTYIGGGVCENTAPVSFACSGTGATIVAFEIHDTINRLFFKNIIPTKAVSSGDTLTFAAAALTVSFL